MTTHKPLIMITNDDGIKSPGLTAAVKALCELGDVVVVAPTNQQTSMSRSLHGKFDDYLHAVELEVNNCNIKAYHCNCSPARAVLHAIDVLYTNHKPDLLVSGINYGENLGTNTTISGTIGAAMEGAAIGIPAMSVSVETEIENQHKHAELNWNAAMYFTVFFANILLKYEYPKDIAVFNINIPIDATPETPWKITKQSRLAYFSNIIESPVLTSTIGDGKCIRNIDEQYLEPDSDIYAVIKNKVVSITPLSLDMTSRVLLPEIETNLNNIDR
jgi:5'-nucleotidase